MTKKQVHVHIHSERTPTRDGDDEGRWVTISGARVFIGKGGKIEKGPSALVGKSATGEHLDAAQRHKEQGSRKGEKHGDFGHHLNAMHSHTGAAIHANKPESEEYGKHAAEAAAHEAKLGKKENKEGGKPGHGGKTVGNSNKPERPPSKAALRGQAKGEYELASRGQGSYAKAADLYERAGEKEKAEVARALARRDDARRAARQKEDLANAVRVRAEAEQYTGTVKETLLREAALHEKLAAEDAPNGTDKTTRELRQAQDASAYEMERWRATHQR